MKRSPKGNQPKAELAQNGMRLWDWPAVKNRAFGWRKRFSVCVKTRNSTFPWDEPSWFSAAARRKNAARGASRGEKWKPTSPNGAKEEFSRTHFSATINRWRMNKGGTPCSAKMRFYAASSDHEKSDSY